MIQKIPYLSIDFQEYNRCVQHSCQKKYSATSEFLDACAGKKQWEILVYGNYEAVMPIPFRKKMGLKWVVHPKLCQQLGVFSTQDDQKLNQAFLDFLNKNYRVLYYGFNEFNQFEQPLSRRKNYIIPKQNYQDAFKQYSPKRKRKLRLDEEVAQNSEKRSVQDVALIEDFIRKNSKGAHHPKDVEEFISIYISLFQKKKLIFYGFFYHEKLVNLLAIHLSEDSVALLGTFNEKEYIKLNGSSVLVDTVIRDFVQEKDFDFEGSEVPSIEEFFRGYRPDLRPYTYFENYSKRWSAKSLRLLKKMIGR
ncbi:MAG: hypothetical protein JSS94_03580 [Bacteroidetes bacterium]|nr:hypothetical protein [Bacteroidota bacterium]